VARGERDPEADDTRDESGQRQHGGAGDLREHGETDERGGREDVELEGEHRGGGDWQSLLRQRFSVHSERRDLDVVEMGHGTDSSPRAWNPPRDIVAGAGVLVPINIADDTVSRTGSDDRGDVVRLPFVRVRVYIIFM